MLLAIRRSLAVPALLAVSFLVPACGGVPEVSPLRAAPGASLACIERCDFKYDQCVPPDENAFQTCLCDNARSECLQACDAWPVHAPRACART